MDLVVYNEHSRYIDQLNALAMLSLILVGMCLVCMVRRKTA